MPKQRKCPTSVLISTPGITTKPCLSAARATASPSQKKSCSVRQTPSSPALRDRSISSSRSRSESQERARVCVWRSISIEAILVSIRLTLQASAPAGWVHRLEALEGRLVGQGLERLRVREDLARTGRRRLHSEKHRRLHVAVRWRHLAQRPAADLARGARQADARRIERPHRLQAVDGDALASHLIRQANGHRLDG